MGLFSFTQEIAMDLGTANTIIITGGKIVVDEPSVVALDRRTDKMIAVGEKAKLMHEKPFFSTNVSLDGTRNYGYFIPVYQNGTTDHHTLSGF